MDKKRTGRTRATCPDCGHDAGAVNWRECLLVADPDGGEPLVYVAYECLACGALWDTTLAVVAYHLTDPGTPEPEDGDQAAAQLARIERLGGAR